MIIVRLGEIPAISALTQAGGAGAKQKMQLARNVAFAEKLA
jgi:hypothetical protein